MLAKPLEQPHLWPSGLLRFKITIDDLNAPKGRRHTYASFHVRSRCDGFHYLAWGRYGVGGQPLALDGIRSSIGLAALKLDICRAIEKQTGYRAVPAPLTAAQRKQLAKDFPLEDR